MTKFHDLGFRISREFGDTNSCDRCPPEANAASGKCEAKTLQALPGLLALLHNNGIHGEQERILAH